MVNEKDILCSEMLVSLHMLLESVKSMSRKSKLLQDLKLVLLWLLPFLTFKELYLLPSRPLCASIKMNVQLIMADALMNVLILMVHLDVDAQKQLILSDDLRTCVSIAENPDKLASFDECAEDNGGCSHTCIDLLDGYECNCPEFMLLEADNKTCSN